MFKKRFLPMLLAVVALTIAATPAFAQPRPGFGELYYNGEVVRTVAPPAAFPNGGIDNLYAIPNQRSVTAVAPGDTDYHGGHWAVYVVTWNVTPYLLTSEQAVLDAETAGDVNITRAPENDVLCPVQP